MTIILKDYTIAGAGTFALQQPVHWTVFTEAARRAVTHWLAHPKALWLAGFQLGRQC